MAAKENQPMISMIVEWGQVDSGLNALTGALQGLAGKQTLREMSPRVRAEAMEDFGRRADARSLARAGSIAHTYEWGAAGTPAGRLWYVTPTAAGDNLVFNFRDSQRPVPLGGTAESDRRQRADHERAIHVWKNKASELEYKSSWTVTAGDTNPETLVKASAGPAARGYTKFLLIYQNGEYLYRKRWRNYSQYTGHFTAFFEDYWQNIAPDFIENQMVSSYKNEIQPQIVKEVKAAVLGKGKIGPRTPPRGVITHYSNGKPITAKGIGNVPNKKIERTVRQRVKNMFGRRSR